MELPAEPQIRWILRRTAALLALGAEPVGGLVTPTSEFFPDAFDGSPRSIDALLARVKRHAGLSHVATELVVVSPEGEAQPAASSCSSGACGGGGRLADAKIERLAALPDGSYRVAVAAGETKSAVVLTTGLVRAVSAIFLIESGAIGEIPPQEREPAIDLAAILLGFGPLVANGSYIYQKGCGGVAVHSATRMPVEEVGLALAVFCRLHEIDGAAATKHLQVTPREAFDEAAVWASSNAAVIRKLRAQPDVILGDDYSLSPARSWLARVLGVGKKKASSPGEEIDELERALSVEGEAKRLPRPKKVDPVKAKRLAEIKALMDEG